MQKSPLTRPGTATRYHVCPYRDLRFDLSAAAGGRLPFSREGSAPAREPQFVNATARDASEYRRRTKASASGSEASPLLFAKPRAERRLAAFVRRALDTEMPASDMAL